MKIDEQSIQIDDISIKNRWHINTHRWNINKIEEILSTPRTAQTQDSPSNLSVTCHDPWETLGRQGLDDVTWVWTMPTHVGPMPAADFHQAAWSCLGTFRTGSELMCFELVSNYSNWFQTKRRRTSLDGPWTTTTELFELVVSAFQTIDSLKSPVSN